MVVSERRLPSQSIVNSFFNRFEEAYEALNDKETVRPYWNAFPQPVLFSYHNELLQQYSYIVVTRAGSSDVNGTYYPIGVLNKSFVWQNDQHMFLSRECIDGELGWIFGNMQICYYGQRTQSVFPPTEAPWHCYTGVDPPPLLELHLGGECQSVYNLKSKLKLTQTVVRWNHELEGQFL